MSLDLIEYFDRRQSEEKSDYLGIYCELDYPDQKGVGYSIHSFGEDGSKSPDQKMQWEKTEGVDAFFEFETYGIVEHPANLKHCKCKLMLNPLSSTERYGLNEKGAIGDGWFEKDRFLLRLTSSLDATRGLFEQMKRKKETEEQKDRFRIRFDLVGLARRKEIVSYSICRTYC